MGRMSAVSLDLDGTLVQYERSPGEVLQACFDSLELNQPFAVEDYYARFDEFARTCETMDELRAECFAVLATENGYDRQLGRDVATVFSEERDQSNVTLLPAAARVLDDLSRKHELAIVTNGTRDAQRRKIDAVELDQWVDTVIVAGHDTPPKPDPAPFERAVESLGTPPGTTVHVGDSLETDVAGAIAAGLDSVWISGGADPRGVKPTYVVPSIEDLLALRWLDASDHGDTEMDV